MGTEGWCRVACVSEFAAACASVCAFVHMGVTKVKITQVEHVWLLRGTEINSCRCSKWHDNQSPPHHHLPPLCQFVTAHPSVALPSFNIEQEHNSGRTRRKKRKEGENKGTDKDRSPRGQQWERSTGVYRRAKTRSIHRGHPGDPAGSDTCNTLDLNLDRDLCHMSRLSSEAFLSELFMQKAEISKVLIQNKKKNNKTNWDSCILSVALTWRSVSLMW